MNLDGKPLQTHSSDTNSAIVCRVNKSGEALIYVSEFAEYDELLKALIQFCVERNNLTSKDA